MTSLCVPVTDIFRRNQDKLLPLVDAVSFKEPTDDVFPDKEHMLECSVNVADPEFEQELENLGLLAALRSGRFTSFACDVGPAWAVVNHGRSPNGYPRYLPGIGSMTEEEYLEQAHQNVSFLRKQFSGKIKVENLNYFPTGAYELVCEPSFICRAIRYLDIELLLDIGHLAISVQNLAIKLENYLNMLPMETVSEVQLSGSNYVNSILEDTHELPSKSDMETLNLIVSMSKVKYLTIEYYKEDERLLEGYQSLFEWVATVKAKAS